MVMSMTDELTKQARYKAKRNKEQIPPIDMYLDDPVEAHIYQTWKNEKNKKQLFIKMYSEYLASKNSPN